MPGGDVRKVEVDLHEEQHRKEQCSWANQVVGDRASFGQGVLKPASCALHGKPSKARAPKHDPRRTSGIRYRMQSTDWCDEDTTCQGRGSEQE
eukprot:scaffold201170_cov33-Tisochrysis_lutea.AAC.6